MATVRLVWYLNGKLSCGDISVFLERMKEVLI